MKQIANYNSKGQQHGYQQWVLNNYKVWFRGCCINGLFIGYHEVNYLYSGGVEDEGTIVNFYIR